MKYTITLPLPHPDLSPNARVHHMAKARAVKSHRGFAYMIARHHIGSLKLSAATVQATFFFKAKRRRDPDNLLSSLKAAFDGMVDAGVFVDDCGLTHLPVQQRIDKENPRVEITITAEGA